MKKILLTLLVFAGLAFTFTGCDENDILTPEQKAELLSTYYPNIFSDIKGDDGDSAYEVAVNEGFVGTVEEWLQSLVGADGEDGVDGVCPECDAVLPEPEPVVCFVDEAPDLNQSMAVAFYTDKNITEAKLGHTVDGFLKTIEDAVVVTLPGGFLVEGNVSIEEDGHHAVGLYFNVSTPEPVVVPEVEEVL